MSKELTAQERTEDLLKAFHEEGSLGKVYDRRLIARLWPYIVPHRKLLFLALGGVLVTAATSLLRPLVMLDAIDNGVLAGDAGVLLRGGVALAGLSGVLLAPVYSVFPTMGRDFVLIAFSVVIIGGMGSIKGAVVAGLLLTQVQSISSLFISPVWSDPLLFSIMVLVLMWRPLGLFGRLGHG